MFHNVKLSMKLALGFGLILLVFVIAVMSQSRRPVPGNYYTVHAGALRASEHSAQIMRVFYAV